MTSFRRWQKVIAPRTTNAARPVCSCAGTLWLNENTPLVPSRDGDP